MNTKELLLDLEEPLHRLKCAVNAVELMMYGPLCGWIFCDLELSAGSRGGHTKGGAGRRGIEANCCGQIRSSFFDSPYSNFRKNLL